MILFLDNQNKIYAANDNLKKEDVLSIKNCVWYDGDFSFFDGEEKDGYIKVHKWDGEKPIVEYKQFPEPPQPTQLDNIEETQLMIMEAMADQYEQRLETDLMMMDAQATTFETVLALTEGVV